MSKKLTPNTKYFRYKLNENCGDTESMSINGKVVTKDWGCESILKLEVLSGYVRSKTNIKGFVDYEQFNSTTDEVYYNSAEEVEFKPYQKHTNGSLSSMDWYELKKIAVTLGLNIKNKSYGEVIDLILDLQEQVSKTVSGNYLDNLLEIYEG